MSLLDNLVSSWKLDEASGTRYDSHGGYHLTDVNTVGSAIGKINDAASFVSANSEYLTRSYTAALDPEVGDGTFTITAWVLRTSLDRGTIAMIGSSNGGGQFGFALECSPTNRLRLYWDGSGGGISDSQLLSAGIWYFLAAGYDGAAGWVSVNAGTRSTLTRSLSGWNNSGNFSIGQTNGTTGRYHNGQIDELGYWSRSLSDPELAQLYNSGNGLAYPFTRGGSIFRNRLVHSPVIRSAL